MKSVAVVTLACMLAAASAFNVPHMATRAVGNPFKKAAKKEAPAPVSFTLPMNVSGWI
jgi:hypothetical protein